MSEERLLAHVRAELRCRCCNQPGLTVFVQELPHRSLVMVHCENRACKLWAVTRDLADWLTLDLTTWGAQQHSEWNLPSELDRQLRRDE